MDRRPHSLRRTSVAIPLDTQARYWRALVRCVELAGILLAVFVGAKFLAERLGPTRPASLLAPYQRLNQPIERDIPSKAPAHSHIPHDPFNARPVQLLDLFELPSSTAASSGIFAAVVCLILVAPQFSLLGRLLCASALATREDSPNNPRAPPTR
jgi:hypothetical protein